MAIIENQSQVENKRVFEFVVGSLVITVLGLVVLSFFNGNLFSSKVLATLGIFIGVLYSKHKFQLWSLFVAQKILADSKHPAIIQRFVSMSYALLLLFALNLIGNYVSIRFEIIIGINEIMVSCYLGYFLWLLWLYNRMNKKMEKGFDYLSLW
jgi:hypothetical protein